MRNDIFCSFEKYNRMVESIEYQGWSLKIDPVAKYPGSMAIEYKYMAQKDNSEEDIKNGAKGIRTLAPMRFRATGLKKLFKGFDTLTDFRIQCTRKEIMEQLKTFVDKYGATES